MYRKFCRECGHPVKGEAGVAKYFCSAACMAPAAFWAVSEKGYSAKGYQDRRAVEKRLNRERQNVPKASEAAPVAYAATL